MPNPALHLPSLPPSLLPAPLRLALCLTLLLPGIGGGLALMWLGDLWQNPMAWGVWLAWLALLVVGVERLCRHLQRQQERQGAYVAAILEHLPQGISVFDEELRLRYWNDKFTAVLDLPAPLVRNGVSFADLIRVPAERGEYGPGEVDELLRLRVAAARRFQAHRLERQRPNGHTHLVEGCPIRIDGELRGFVTTYTDITEQRQREEEQQQKNELLATIIDNIPSAISAFDADLRLLAYNRRATSLLRMPDEMLQPGASFESFIRFNAQRGEYGPGDTESQVQEILERARNFQPHRFVRQRPDGTALDICGTPLPGGGFVTIYSDITDKQRLEQERERRSAYLKAILDQLPQGVSVFDEKLRLQHWNHLFVDVLDIPPELVHENARFEDLIMVPALRGEYGPGDPAELVRTRRELAMRFQPHRLVRTRPNGKTHQVEGTPLYVDNRLAGFITTYTDISERTLVEENLRSKNAMLQTLIDNIPGGVTLFDRDFRLVAHNAEYQRLLDFPDELFAGTPTLESFFRYNAQRGEYGAPEDGDMEGLVRKFIERAKLREAHLFERIRPDGTVLEVRGLPLPDGGFVTIYTDITERKEAQKTIERLAHFEPLTGLANRYTLLARLEQALADARRRDTRLAIIFIDLDRFKQINDTLGHSVGDQLLIAVAERLRQTVREQDVVARLGGDEFVVVLNDIADMHAVSFIADQLRQVISTPVTVEGHTLNTSGSLGIALFPDDGGDQETLLRNADTAMYHSKASGRSCCHFFNPAMNAATLQRLQMENDLRQALSQNEFSLHLQPQIHLGSGRIAGMEALIRWQRADGSYVPPCDFIPVAEDCGLIHAIGDWVIREGIAILQRWHDDPRHDQRLDELQLSINLSAHQLSRPELPEQVGDYLREAGISPERIEFEITETVAMQNPEQTVRNLQALRQLGVALAIDDFGTGYSSLNYLKLFPINRLKLDRTFVQDVDHDPNDAAICAAAIGLGHNLGLDVVAEGVETASQYENLARMGCDLIQGYYFSKPLPVCEAKALFLASDGMLRPAEEMVAT